MQAFGIVPHKITNQATVASSIVVCRSKGKSAEGIYVEQRDVSIIKKFATEAPSAIAELLATGDAVSNQMVSAVAIGCHPIVPGMTSDLIVSLSLRKHGNMQEARAYPAALVKVLMNVTDVRVIQYALTLIRDFIEAAPDTRVKYLVKPGAGASGLYILPFLQLVGTSGSGARILSTEANPYVLEQAAICAANMIAADASDETATSGMLAWVLTNLKLFGSLVAKQVKVTEVAVESLMILLRNDFIRSLFVEEKGVERLVPMLAARNTQMLYDACYCLWTLSLQRPVTVELERAGATTAIARLCRVGMPLKVLRVGLATLANIARNPACADALAEVCETHVPVVVDQLSTTEPRVTDPELLEDLRWLRDAIAGNTKTLTSVERYEKEITSGRLEWTGVHSGEFFRENALKLEAGEFRAIKALAALLQDPNTDEVSQAVALHDLGEFAVAHPNGRQ